jgi:endoglucanase
VNYVTGSTTATTTDHDFAAASGTLTFDPGVTSRTIIVSIQGDRTIEPDETFFVKLLNPTHAVLANDKATGTLLNDDI